MGRMPEKLIPFTSVWYLFPRLFDHWTPRKTDCSFAPGFVIFTFPEDAASISLEGWEFESRAACCVHKGTISLWHQQNPNCKVSILEPALRAVKIVFFKSFIYWSTKASSVWTCFPWLTAKAGFEDCCSSQTQLCWDSRRFCFWRPRPVMNGAALEIQLAKAFCYSAITKTIL